MTDIAETIARLRTLYVSGRAGDWQDICRMEREIWKVLPDVLSAAEAGIAARDAALEEAAEVAERHAIARSFAKTIAMAIRALRSKP